MIKTKAKFSALLLKDCHSVQYPLEGCKKQENWKCFYSCELANSTKALVPAYFPFTGASYLYLAVILVLSAGLFGCGKGINKSDNEIFCPVDYTFQASYDKAWNATRKAVMELCNVEVMNVNIGIITSDITTVKGEEMVFLDHAPNKTYKYTYDIKLRREEKDATKISTQVKLLPEQFLLQSNKINKKTQVESYLREKLYKKVCSNLFPDGKGHCSNGFIEQTIEDQQPAIVTTPSPPPPKGFDPKIKSAQQALNSAGYKAGPEDGLIGKKTRRALKSFQQDNGLKVTGSLDEKTQSLLLADVEQSVEDEQTEKTTPPLPPSPKGFDTKIKSAQQALNRAGYKAGPEDGLIGKKTRRALSNFQRESGLAVTGSLDEKTHSLLSAYLQDDPGQSN